MTYIAGVGCARIDDGRAMSLEELVFRAAAEALDDGGISRDEVDSLSLAASDQLDGRAISSMLLAAPAGGYLVDEIRCTEDGALALGMAAQRIRSEVSDWALAVSWTKSTESPILAALGVNAEPLFTRPAGLHPLAMEALEVQRFLHDAGVAADRFDELAARRRELGGRSADGDAEAPLALPIRSTHVPPQDDVAVAVLLTSHPRRVRLTSFAHGVEDPAPLARIGTPGAMLREKAAQVYASAGLSDPKGCRIVETTDRHVFRLAMNVAGLGLSDAGDAADRLLVGDLAHVNEDGGLWRRNPVLAAGLDVTVRAYQRLRDPGDEAICHSSFGMAGNGQAVWVMKAVA